MFDTILIANRGEIACRVIKTARNMGIETLAIYSSVDKNSLHVRQADRAFYVGEAPASSSYLNIDAIIRAALAGKAQAIHPGYGFLSENAQFARACSEAGLVFIGPSVAAMETMASKQLAKQRLEGSAVPLTPGYHGSNQSEERLLQEARQIGFPVLLKAAAGGGGKGMRSVMSETDFVPALTGARRESMAAFGDDTMIIEKLMINPRHIEVQIMADHFGEVVHLFDRDCSVQRRHQKIVEEAPAPGLTPALRQQLADAACDVARSIDYHGAGTVEFLLDKEDKFYFMEMNTRLQVEHPVTEMITGLDLVAWQIRIAAGQPLPCKQQDIIQTGHAIECRIYAEDPLPDYLPSTGQLHFLQEPQGQGIRIDSGVVEGSVITQYYDPMIAKLIASGESRAEALQRLQQALKGFAIGGVKSNLPFLRALCSYPRFIRADLGTAFLSEETITLPTPDPVQALSMAAAYDYLQVSAREQDPVFLHTFGWHMHLPSHWCQRYVLNDEETTLIIHPIHRECFVLEMNDCRRTLSARLTGRRLTLDDGEQTHTAWMEEWEDALICYQSEGVVRIERASHQPLSGQPHAEAHQLTAPMPATIVALLKKPGDRIKMGDPLMILEAMKMEHTIHAPRDGVLTEFFYNTGDQVAEGVELLMLEDVL